jgi:hypothetical protein
VYQINQCPPKRCSNEILRRRFGSRSPRQGLNVRFFPFRERSPMLAQTFGKPAVSTARHGARTLWGSFSAGPGKTCCRNKPQQEEPPVGLEAGSQLNSQGKWLGVGGTFLWDFTYLCWNLTRDKSQSTMTKQQRCRHMRKYCGMEE